LAQIPSPEEILCARCKAPMVFLLQVYAPEFTQRLTVFHRTVFLFMCRQAACHGQGQGEIPFKVFRCQLPRNNDFYPSDPPEESDDWRPDVGRAEDHGTKLCRLCGCKADKHCAGCKKVSYCSREHQTIDWKKGGHKTECRAGELDGKTRSSLVNLPEFELETEEAEKEDFPDSSDEDDEGGGEDADVEEKRKFVKMKMEGKTGDLSEDDVKEVDSDDNDRAVMRFRGAVANSPDQVLRYSAGGKPLWISGEHLPGADLPPKCEVCGSERQFEFQVMPQMLFYLELDEDKAPGEQSVDWGVLAVYSCKGSCDGDATTFAYKSEYIFRQFPSSSN
jgi:pre-rRNA-processing protein TSR4